LRDPAVTRHTAVVIKNRGFCSSITLFIFSSIKIDVF
jgi:hypothetical protein